MVIARSRSVRDLKFVIHYIKIHKSNNIILNVHSGYNLALSIICLCFFFWSCFLNSFWPALSPTLQWVTIAWPLTCFFSFLLPFCYYLNARVFPFASSLPCPSLPCNSFSLFLRSQMIFLFLWRFCIDVCWISFLTFLFLVFCLKHSQILIKRNFKKLYLAVAFIYFLKCLLIHEITTKLAF